MSSIKRIVLLLMISETFANVIYGENCEKMIQNKKPFICEERFFQEFIHCYIPKSNSKVSGCEIDLSQSKFFNQTELMSTCIIVISFLSSDENEYEISFPCHFYYVCEPILEEEVKHPEVDQNAPFEEFSDRKSIPEAVEDESNEESEINLVESSVKVITPVTTIPTLPLFTTTTLASTTSTTTTKAFVKTSTIGTLTTLATTTHATTTTTASTTLKIASTSRTSTLAPTTRISTTTAASTTLKVASTTRTSTLATTTRISTTTKATSTLAFTPEITTVSSTTVIVTSTLGTLTTTKTLVAPTKTITATSATTIATATTQTVEEDDYRFPNLYIIISAISVSIVLLIAVCIGVSCLVTKKKVKSNDLELQKLHDE